jgi:hypothetical protein
MNYKSIVPTNAPKTKGAPDVRPFSNTECQQIYSSKKKIVQAASSLIEKQSMVVQSSFVNNGFMTVVHTAFAEHLPLLIIPDDIWHIFLSQVAIIVNKNPERYRESFVDHKGKKSIEVINDSLVMDVTTPGMSANWESIFPVFEQKMNEKMKIDINRKFSTTTRIHYTVSQILIMNAMKHYVNYGITTKCGFPKIRIGGTLIDWEILDTSIQEVCSKIFELGPNYSNFINESKKVIQGSGNPDYWGKLYHFNRAKGSGQSDTVTGIVNDLFPFDSDCKRAPGAGLKRNTDSFPEVNGKVPFLWSYLGTKNRCEFEAGLTHAGWDQEAGHLYCKPTWKISRFVKNITSSDTDTE